MLSKELIKHPVRTQCQHCEEIGYMPEQWLGVRKECGKCNEMFVVTKYTDESDES